MSKGDLQDYSADSQSKSKADPLAASPLQTGQDAGEIHSMQSKPSKVASSAATLAATSETQADSLVAAVHQDDQVQFVDVKVRCQAGPIGLAAVSWRLPWRVQ